MTHLIVIFFFFIKFCSILILILDRLLMKAQAVQRFMENCLANYINQFAALYSHTLVYSKSFRDHATHPQLILQWFRERRLRLKSSECWFTENQVKLTVHIFTTYGSKVDPPLTKTITKCLGITKFSGDPPKSIASVSRIVDLLKYFSRHIRSFNSVAWQPYDLLIKKVISAIVLVNEPLFNCEEKSKRSWYLMSQTIQL